MAVVYCVFLQEAMTLVVLNDRSLGYNNGIHGGPMRKGRCFFLMWVFLLILSGGAFAVGAGDAHFDLKQANIDFAAIQNKLNGADEYVAMQPRVDQLNQMQAGATSCVTDAETQLKLINALLSETPAVAQASVVVRSDTAYLKEKQKYYAEQLAGCRLLVYRTQEVINTYKNKMQELSANEILQKTLPGWQVQRGDWENFIHNFDLSVLKETGSIHLFGRNQIIIGFFLFFIVAIIAFNVRRLIHRTLMQMHKAHVLWSAIFSIFSTFIVPVALLTYCGLYVHIIFLHEPTPSFIELSFHAIVVTTLSMAFVKFLFYPSPILPGLFSLPVELGQLFYRRIAFLLWVLCLGYCVTVTLHNQNIPTAIENFTRSFFYTLVSVLGAWTFLLWLHMPSETRMRHRFVMFLLSAVLVLLTGLVVAEWLGYHRLAIFSIVGFCFTVIYTVCTLALWRLIEVLYRWVDNKQFLTARHVHRIFGVKLNHRMHEISLLKFSIQFSLFCVYVILILKSWNVSANFVDYLCDGLLSGFKFVGITVVPSRIILALISFSIILLIGRFISTMVAHKNQFHEEDTQIAIATITIYISFAIAFVFALVITGVNFTGLAIIAGALSVGVGLGLQNIVNNFVSGLILLIEKPIKPGDRISFGMFEGFVKKIRIRSTQIATIANEDVIIPNADLITQPVTNYMYLDHRIRVVCQVGVAYGSDVQLVRKLLLQVAADHPEVVKEPKKAPLVLFTSFGNSSLLFELWCVIHDVNKRYIVGSELNFAIDEIFRANGITIAFPQLDLHIKSNNPTQVLK